MYACMHCVGSGEEFMRHVAAYDISCRMEYGSCSLSDAVCGLVHRRLPPDSGGVIAVDKTGAMCLEFNTPGMMRGWITHDGEGGVGIWGETKPVRYLLRPEDPSFAQEERRSFCSQNNMEARR
jgi:isoaspartyl peptidase/L-asparaginase-like protein (Ntn-hydrolase superfamily)